MNMYARSTSTTIFILNEQQVTVGIMDPTLPKALPYSNDILETQLDKGYSTFECDIPSNHEQSALLQVEGFLLVPTIDGTSELFQIKEIEDTHDGSGTMKHVSCEAAAISELITQPVRPSGTTLLGTTIENALAYALGTSTWKVGKVEVGGLQDIVFTDYTNSLDAIHQIVKAFGGEVAFDCTLSGTKIQEKRVNVYVERGNKIDKPFRYTQDLTSVKRTESSQDLVTAMIGVGKGDANGQVLTLSSYNPPSVEEGFEKVDDYIGSIESRERFGLNGKHRFGVFQDNQAKTQAELYNNTLAELKKRMNPRLTYEVKVVLLSRLTGYEAHKVRLGDRVVIQDFTFKPTPLLLNARIISMKTSLTDKSKDEVVLGEFIPILSTADSVIQRLQSTLRQNEQKWDSAGTTANTALTTANDVKATVDPWKHPSDTTKLNGGQIYNGSVTAAQIAGNTITGDKIAAGAITAGSAIIADAAITDAKIADLSVSKLKAGSIDTSKHTITGPTGKVVINGDSIQVLGGSLEVYSTPTATDAGIMLKGNKVFTNFLKNPDFFQTPSATTDWTLYPSVRYDSARKVVLIDTTSTMVYTGISQDFDVFHPKATFQALLKTTLVGGSTPKKVRFYIYNYDSAGNRLADLSKEEQLSTFQDFHLLNYSVIFPTGTVKCRLFVQVEMKYMLTGGMEIHWVKGVYDDYATQKQIQQYPRDIYNVKANPEIQLFNIDVTLASSKAANSVILCGRVDFDRPFTSRGTDGSIVVMLTPYDGNSVTFSARPYAIDEGGFTLYLISHITIPATTVKIGGLAYRAGYIGQVGFSI